MCTLMFFKIIFNFISSWFSSRFWQNVEWALLIVDLWAPSCVSSLLKTWYLLKGCSYENNFLGVFLLDFRKLILFPRVSWWAIGKRKFMKKVANRNLKKSCSVLLSMTISALDQRHIQNPVKYLRWSFSWKKLTAERQ